MINFQLTWRPSRTPNPRSRQDTRRSTCRQRMRRRAWTVRTQRRRPSRGTSSSASAWGRPAPPCTSPRTAPPASARPRSVCSRWPRWRAWRTSPAPASRCCPHPWGSTSGSRWPRAPAGWTGGWRDRVSTGSRWPGPRRSEWWRWTVVLCRVLCLWSNKKII